MSTNLFDLTGRVALVTGSGQGNAVWSGVPAEARVALIMKAVENIEAVLAGRPPLNPVKP